MLSNPAPRPARSYDPTIVPHREDGAVHVHDHRTVRALLRDSRRVTSDVSDLVGPGQRVHPVSAFVWATDRLTIGGCPGRHAALRSAMAPWMGAEAVEQRHRDARDACGRHAAQLAGRPFDVYADYAEPLVVEYLAGWLGVEESDVRFAVGDQLAAGEMFATWPPPTTDELDEHYRGLMARPGLGGVAAAARDLRDRQVITEREAWGIVYALSVSAVATATAITLATGLSVEHGLWPGMADPAGAGAAVEEAVRLGSPFPQATRFAREAFTLGDVLVEPGEQVLMWLTAANRDLPGPHRASLDRFDPTRDASAHLGWGSGYHTCGGVRHARALAEAAVTALARHCPTLTHDGPWVRFVGIDDGYAEAPVTA
ncbi:cytochrome P450 [Pseudonocardia humida]|uniref:Cytochrome P450 n=1 Tax=Pseudonocardia humida TaxID=2800819 RepID=A0ABT1AA11_9PSEU|nr:cytochrome P450 [Pseudonocardia humida]MCO1659875.1 cytochrome P450 [Pseudonocardia humida]